MRVIEPLLRSLKFFSAYEEYDSADLHQFVQDIKLHKVTKGTRIYDAEEIADTVYVILAGRVAIAHATPALLDYKTNPKVFKERVEFLTTRQKERFQSKTFLTSGNVCNFEDVEEYKQMLMKEQMLEDAKAKN